MDRGRRGPRAGEPGVVPLPDAVPSRAVLTELARGFLMMHDRDPGRAARFAATFLRERATESGEPGMTLLPRLPQIRRTAWADSGFWTTDEGRRT